MKQFFTNALLFVSTILFSQTGSIRGNVYDAETEQPLAYGTVAVINPADSLIVTGSLTNEDGSFEVTEIPFGEYLVEISFIGYDSQQLGPYTIGREERQVDLGNLSLGANQNELEAVTIEGEAPLVRYEVDKKVYDASQIKAAEGGTAKDVLEQIPSITVNSDQTIQLRGSGNVRVLVNGRPSSFSMNTILEQIPQKNIKDIEIITNPSAKYDAEGEVGIINIILKENDLEGLTGGVNGNWGTENKWNGGGNLAYRTGKWNLSTSYNFNRFRDDFYRDTYRILKDLDETVDQYSDEDRDFVRNGHFARVGVDYYFDDANTLFLSGSYNVGNGANDGVVLSENMYTSLYTGNGYLTPNYYDYDRISDGDQDQDGYEFTGSFQHVFGGNQAHNLLADFSYNQGDEENVNDYFIDQFVDQDNNVTDGFSDFDQRRSETNNTRFSLDYTNPFDGKQKLEAGYRSTLESRDENFVVLYNDQFYEPSSGFFDFQQDIHAAYFTYQNQISEKVGLKGGLRGEYTEVNSVADGGQNASYQDDYFNLFPTASASYQVNQDFQLNASFSRRIARPGGRQLNPFADRTDPNNVFVGNNALTPQYSNNYEVGFNKMWDALTLDGSVYHRAINDQIQFKNTYIEETDVNEISFFNLAKQKVYGAEATFNLQPQNITWYSLRLSGNYNYSNITENDDEDVDISTNEFEIFSGNIANNFRFNNGMNAQLNLRYQSPFRSYFGKLNAMYGINANIGMQVLNNKGNVYLRANDVFNTFGLDANIEDENRIQSFTLDWPSQMAFIGFNYNFGNLKQPARRKMERRQEQGEDNQPTIGM